MSDGGSAWMNSKQWELHCCLSSMSWLRSGSTKLIYVTKSDQKRNSPYLIGIRCFPNQPRMGRPLQQKDVFHRCLMKRTRRFMKCRGQGYESLRIGACESLSHTPLMSATTSEKTACATFTPSTSTFAFSSLSTSQPILHTQQSWRPRRKTRRRSPEMQRYDLILLRGTGFLEANTKLLESRSCSTETSRGKCENSTARGRRMGKGRKVER